MKTQTYCPVDLNDFFNRLPSKNLIKKLLDDFVSSSPDFLKELEETIHTGDIDTVKKAAHKIKGVLGNLSITKGYYLALDFEKNIDWMSREEMKYRFNEIKVEFEAVQKYMNSPSELIN